MYLAKCIHCQPSNVPRIGVRENKRLAALCQGRYPVSALAMLPFISLSRSRERESGSEGERGSAAKGARHRESEGQTIQTRPEYEIVWMPVEVTVESHNPPP